MTTSLASRQGVRQGVVRHRIANRRPDEERMAADPAPARMRMLVGAMRQGTAGLQRLPMPDRRHLIQTVQSTGGNAAVQRLLLSPGHPSIQRQPGGEPLLRMGSSSPAVAMLQQHLVSAGAQIVPDGAFGPATHKAVVAFQQAAGLSPDGLVGPKTWGALKSGSIKLAQPPESKPANGMPPHVMVKLETLKAAMRSLHAGGTAPDLAAPEARPIAPAPRPITGWLEEKVDAASDWAGEQVESASDWAGEQVDAATDWAGDKVDAATDWAGEQAGAASDWVEEKVSDAKEWAGEQVGEAGAWVEEQVEDAAGWVQEQAGAAGEWVEEKVDAAVQTVKEEIKEIGDGLRERFPEEMAVVDQIVSEVGRGLGIDWKEIEARVDKVVANLAGQAGIETSEGETCTAGATTINTSTKGISVSAGNVQDAIDAANTKQGGHVASVLPVFNPLPAKFCPAESENKPVHAATVEINEVKTVPDWKEKDTKGFEEAKKIWTTFIGVVDAHEEKHIAIDKKHFTDMHKKAEKKPALSVNAAKAALQKVITAADTENAALDAKEGCIKLAASGNVSQHPRGQC